MFVRLWRTISNEHICHICTKLVYKFLFIKKTNYLHVRNTWYVAHLRLQCHNSKCVIFQERLLKVLKCRNFLWVQRRHNCSPAASFANCVMTLYLLKVHLQTFLSIIFTFVPCILLLSSFLLQSDAQENCFQSSIKICIKIKIAPTCFGVITIIREHTKWAC